MHAAAAPEMEPPIKAHADPPSESDPTTILSCVVDRISCLLPSSENREQDGNIRDRRNRRGGKRAEELLGTSEEFKSRREPLRAAEEC